MRPLLIVLSTLLLVLSCTTSPPQGDSFAGTVAPFSVISGTIFYPNNLYFPSRVRLEIALIARDTSTRTERVLVTQSIRNPQRFPVNFIIRYEAKDIQRNNEHLISVELYRETESTPYLRALPVLLPDLSGNESVIIELRTSSP